MVKYAIDLVVSKRVQVEPTVTHILKGLDKVPEAFEVSGNKAKHGAVNAAQVIISE
jgi:threonine dehydrogenase-like Zn-dependent dehydrogenase